MERNTLVGGRYSLKEKLGEGATKDVYLARDGSLGRDVALCSFKPYVVSGGYIDRVRREATTLAGLNHPNIVAMFDFQDDDGWYMTTEYVAGGSLKSKMASVWKDTPDLSEALRIAAEVADALTYAHARGVFHRDIKPSNIMLTPEGTAKLGDFGLAKPFGDESLTDSGLIVGTVPYMSPEQAKGLHPDSPSDMYSLGVTLFEMVTGRRPFHGEDVSVLVHHLNSTPPPPSRYVPTCPPGLETLILELLEKDPEVRPTAGATAVELRRIREELSGEPAPSTAAEPGRWEAPGEPAPESVPATDPTSPESWTTEPTSHPEGVAQVKEIWSEQSFRKGLISDALQYPSTSVPLVIGAGAGLILGLFSDLILAIIVSVGSAVVAAFSFNWRYFVRYPEEYDRWMRESLHRQERLRRERERQELAGMRDTLRVGLSSIQSDSGLGALRRLDYEFSQLQGVFRRWPASDLRSIAQIPALAEETYRQGLTVLISVLELLLAIPPSYKRGLETEVRALERVIRDLEGDDSQTGRLELRRGMLSTHTERLDLITRQELRAEEFLFRSSLSEAALNRTRIELAALRADSSEAGVSAVSESLQRTIDQAREVLEEMRKLGF